MNLIWGVILVSITLKCWIGQIIIAFSPKVAVKIRITEPESEVDPTFFADVHGEAIWGAISLWTLHVVLLLIYQKTNMLRRRLSQGWGEYEN